MTYEFAKEYSLLIGGQWVPAEGGETFETTNPATGEVLARCANASANDVQKAVDAPARPFRHGPQSPHRSARRCFWPQLT